VSSRILETPDRRSDVTSSDEIVAEAEDEHDGDAGLTKCSAYVAAKGMYERTHRDFH
jgi:hypothetical protein